MPSPHEAGIDPATTPTPAADPENDRWRVAGQMARHNAPGRARSERDHPWGVYQRVPAEKAPRGRVYFASKRPRSAQDAVLVSTATSKGNAQHDARVCNEGHLAGQLRPIYGRVKTPGEMVRSGGGSRPMPELTQSQEIGQVISYLGAAIGALDSARIALDAALAHGAQIKAIKAPMDLLRSLRARGHLGLNHHVMNGERPFRVSLALVLREIEEAKRGAKYEGMLGRPLPKGGQAPQKARRS